MQVESPVCSMWPTTVRVSVTSSKDMKDSATAQSVVKNLCNAAVKKHSWVDHALFEVGGNIGMHMIRSM